MDRFRKPEPVASGPMIGVALAAVAVNVLISLWLRAGAKHDLNVRSAYMHMVGDALAAVGVVIAGVIVLLTGESAADPAVSLLIGVMILWSSWGILTDAVDVLMEGTPAHVNMAEVEQVLLGIEGVASVHDLHVWTITSGIHAMSVHVVLAEGVAQAVADAVVGRVDDAVKERFQIAHATTQVERVSHQSEEMTP